MGIAHLLGLAETGLSALFATRPPIPESLLARRLAVLGYDETDPDSFVPGVFAARQVLEVLFAAPRLSAVVLTEVNPSYDADGDSLPRYLAAVAGTLGAGLAD